MQQQKCLKPILSSTLVTIVVFLPLAFVSGSVGEMFRPFALAIAFSLLASLLVSITVVPALAQHFQESLKQQRQVKQNNESLGTVGRGYQKVLSWSLNHKWLVIIITTIILIASVVLGGTKLGTSYISTGEDKFLAVTYTPKPGETEEAVLKHAKDAENICKVRRKVKTVQYSVGGPSPADPTGSTNSMAIMVEYAKNTPHFDEEPDKVLKHLDRYKHPGTWKNLDMGTGVGNSSIEVTVKGKSTEAIKGTVAKVEQAMKKTSGVANVKSDLSETYDQYEIKLIKIKRLTMAFLQVNLR